MYNAYTIGKHIYLRSPTAADAEGHWHEWLSDEETTRWLGMRQWPNTLERQRDFYQAIQKADDRLVLSIVDIASDKHIGVCNLSSINWISRYCDVALVIGEKEFRSGPHAVETMSLMLRIAFLRLNLRAVKSSFSASNTASSMIHDIFRFKEVGRIPGLLWDRGEYVDNVTSVLRREDWMARNKLSDHARQS